MAVGHAGRAAVQIDLLVAAPKKRAKKAAPGKRTKKPAPLTDLCLLTATLQHEFADLSLLDQALRHPSAAALALESNQRMEFLGDRVLGVVVAAMLYAEFESEEEGALAHRFTALVRRRALARVAMSIDLGAHLKLNRGEEDGGGRTNPANLADACEALIAALYLDGGFGAAEKFIRHHWAPLMAEDATPPRDAKTQLQEWVQAKHACRPRYRTLSSEGPAHQPLISVEVSIEGAAPARADGSSKRGAEQKAARILLDQLTRSDD